MRMPVQAGAMVVQFLDQLAGTRLSAKCRTPRCAVTLSASARIAPAGPRSTATSRQASWSRCTCIEATVRS